TNEAFNRRKSRGRHHHVFDVALSRSKLGGSGLVREKACTSDEYSSAELQHSRTNGTPPGPLPQNPVSSVGCRLFDKRRLAGDGFSSVTDVALEISDRWQAPPTFWCVQRSTNA
ncbi:hypothetical protein, partial [Pseudomonas viridiflava]|uniref:hypothetical protein n=1 Tax=Pseudomonas viridiflava TaxID=33069 RepID=UPI00197F13D4